MNEKDQGVIEVIVSDFCGFCRSNKGPPLMGVSGA